MPSKLFAHFFILLGTSDGHNTGILERLFFLKMWDAEQMSLLAASFARKLHICILYRLIAILILNKVYHTKHIYHVLLEKGNKVAHAYSQLR